MSLHDSLIIIQQLIVTAQRIVPSLWLTGNLQGHILLEETAVIHMAQEEKRKGSVKGGNILTYPVWCVHSMNTGVKQVWILVLIRIIIE